MVEKAGKGGWRRWLRFRRIGGIKMKQLPIIRHVRWFWLSWRVHRFAAMCGEIGLGMGYANPSDIQYLDAIWRGEQ
jgi:hypothetical protein